MAVFRDELPNMMPNDENARRLSAQTFTLAEALAKYAPDWTPPTLSAKALVQVHCHQGAVLGFDADQALLKRIGLDLTVPDSGCCGMAGSFGYEAGERYDVSMACGERVILPAVREASAKTIVIADGFSCREQIAQSTERRGLHLAQVVRLAMHAGHDGLGPTPERLAAPATSPSTSRRSRARVSGAALAVAATAAVLARLARRR